MNMNFIKREIQRSIESKKSDIGRLERMAAVISKYEESGWNPDIYKDFTSEVHRLGMCVIHREALYDMTTILNGIDRSGFPQDRDLDDDERDRNTLTQDHVLRAERSIQQALSGFETASLKPTQGMTA